MTITKRVSAEEAAPTAPAKETYYYNFDLIRLPLNPLDRFSPLLLMGENEQSYLDHYKYHPTSGGSDLVQYFKSDWSSSTYLAIVRVANYRLVMHIADDRALREWRKTYERDIDMLPSLPGVLPEPSGDPYMNHKIIHLDPRAVRLNNGFY